MTPKHGIRSAVITRLLIYSLVYACLTPAIGQENHFIIEPAGLSIGAEQGIAEISLAFALDPEPWIAVTEGEWLTIEPLTGEGPGPLTINYKPNDGPVRTGRIMFESVNGTILPAVIEIRQNQGLDPSLIEFRWSQLTIPYTDPMMIPNTGSASFRYLPWDQAVFLNIVGKSLLSDVPAWLVRNVYLPDAGWMAEMQGLRLPVDLGLLGYEIGQPVELIEYSWTVSYESDTIIPVYPDQTWTTAQLNQQTISALGRIGLEPYTPEPLTDYYTNIVPPVEVTDIVYIGCEMPNGDLDESERPGEINGCGPAAAANSLSWLDKQHDEIDVPDEWLKAFNEMSSLMRNRGQGTNDKDFIRAKLDFIEMYDLPIKVKYQDDALEGGIKSSSGNSTAECHDAKAGDMPTKEWMISEAEDDEDVEVGMTFPNGGGHWVVLTGTITINGQTYLVYKDDGDQDNAGGNDQGYTPVNVTDDGMVLPGISNGQVDIVVSESYDPDHIPLPDKIPFEKYCQSSKRTLPPGASITLSYPDNESRCYNTSVRVYNHGEKKGYQLKAVWNHNSGKDRTYVNDTGEPVTVEFHNDDHYDGGEPIMKSTFPFVVSLRKSFNPEGLSTDPSNEESFAGFSLGSDDESSDEFGNIVDPEVNYTFGIGSYFPDFPKRMDPAGCKKINIEYPVQADNRYWKNLGMVIGVSEVTVPGNLYVTSNSTGIMDTISITEAGDYRITLGGKSTPWLFEARLEIDDNLVFEFDNLGVPSLVQVDPILAASHSILTLEPDSAGQIVFNIENLGGTDMEWSLSHQQDWLTVNPQNGTNESEILVDYQANPDAARQDTIVIQAPGARNSPLSIIVYQDGNSSGINNLPVNQIDISLFPNPNTGRFEINITGLEPGLVSCRILDLTGREVWSYSSVINDKQLTLPVGLENYQEGFYLVRIETSLGIRVLKLILEE